MKPNNPLNITLLRDIYQPPPTHNSPTGHADELLDVARFPTPDHITNHLLDHAITTAYTPHPGQPPPRYTPYAAHHTLTVIAEHLRDHHTRDLAWWHMPNWIPRTPRIIINAGLYSAIFGLVAGLLFGLVAGLVFGFAFALVALLPSQSQPTHPSQAKMGGKALWRTAFVGLFVLTVVAGFVAGLLAELAIGRLIGLPVGLMAGLATGLVVGCAVVGDPVDPSTAGHPREMWRTDLVSVLTVGLLFVLAAGVVVGLLFGFVTGLWAGLVGGLVYGLGNTAIWHAAISQIYLAGRYDTPLRLGRFLIDAHKRRLLRTVGPIYQFRHASLQDRLAPPRTASDHVTIPTTDQTNT